MASLIEMARPRSADTRGLLEDPVVRDRIAQFAIDEMAIRCSARRSRVPGLVADRPMAVPLMMKLIGSEHAQRLSDFGCELQGYPGSL